MSNAGAPAYDARGDAARLRRALLGLAAVTTLALALELVFERHWNGFVQVIPWAGIALLGAAVALRNLGSRGRPVALVRSLTLAVAAISLVGVVQHVRANYDAGPLDFRYSDRWESMSPASRWWEASTGGVGPSPVLAPGALALAGLLVWASTLGLPAAGDEPGGKTAET